MSPCRVGLDSSLWEPGDHVGTMRKADTKDLWLRGAVRPDRAIFYGGGKLVKAALRWVCVGRVGQALGARAILRPPLSRGRVEGGMEDSEAGNGVLAPELVHRRAAASRWPRSRTVLEREGSGQGVSAVQAEVGHTGVEVRAQVRGPVGTRVVRRANGSPSRVHVGVLGPRGLRDRQCLVRGRVPHLMTPYCLSSQRCPPRAPPALLRPQLNRRKRRMWLSGQQRCHRR